MEFEYCALTDVGRVRDNNEDALVVDPAHGVVVLADGMGGYNAGEVASALAVELISSELARWLNEAAGVAQTRDVRRAMEICVDTANRAILEASSSNDAYAGMGTTLVMLVVHRDQVMVGHVGDSRAYRWRDGQLLQITHDHSLLQEQIDFGLLTAEQAAASDIGNLVTRALGVEETVLMDVRESPAQIGDTYLLCSDGLNDLVTDAEIAEILGHNVALEVTARRLVGLANACGGHDNVSVVLARATNGVKKRGMMSKLLGK